jgi:hypothetical protein
MRVYIRVYIRVTPVMRVYIQFTPGMGFTVKRDHNAKQHGSTCGLVAASVTTWLHDFGSDFMTATTTEAVNWPVIEEANTAIQRALRNTAITTSDEVQRAANHFTSHIKSSHRRHAQHKQCSFGLRCGLISARSCYLDWGLG